MFVLAILSAEVFAQTPAANQLLGLAPAERLAAPAYGITFKVDIGKREEMIGPEGGCVPAAQAEIDAVYTVGERMVQAGLPEGVSVSEKVILKEADRVILQSTVHGADGAPLAILRNYLDTDRVRCNQVHARSVILLRGEEAGKGVWLYWDGLGK
jgi:hypothetical protein